MTRIGPTRTKVLFLLLDGQARGLPPTEREMARIVGCNQTNIRHHVAALRKAGLVREREPGGRTTLPACRFYRMAS